MVTPSGSWRQVPERSRPDERPVVEIPVRSLKARPAAEISEELLPLISICTVGLCPLAPEPGKAGKVWFSIVEMYAVMPIWMFRQSLGQGRIGIVLPIGRARRHRIVVLINPFFACLEQTA